MALRRPQRDSDEYGNMVLLMGSTGSGKSFFINKLKENATIESSSLYSCTATCQIVQTRIGRTNIAVVDCPGFNDTKRSDTEILGEIAKVLSSQYLLSHKLRLRGILYLRDITKVRMEGSDVKTLDLFTKLVGQEALGHVVFVTTMWGKLDVTGERVAFQRERELKDKFWREMVLAGSYVQRFKGTKDSAEGIISQLIGDAYPVVLQIQHELIDREFQLAATAAGSILVSEVDDKFRESSSKLQRFRSLVERESNSTTRQRFMIDIENAEQEQKRAQSDKNKLEERVGAKLKSEIKEEGDWKDALRTICSVVGVSLTIVVNVILPAAGVSLFSCCSLM